MKRILTIIMILAAINLLTGCQISGSGQAKLATVESVKTLNGVAPVNIVDAGFALKGYDTVAYFQEGKAVEGAAEFSHEYMGAKWLFSNAENRDLFSKAPQKYAPQYGGYCSWAVGHGYTANGDPKAWKIVDGKLYLNYNEDVKKRWEKEESNLIQQGDNYWPRFLENKPEHKG
jgi:YHS domain-containing protein